MNLNTKQFATEISNTLTATEEGYTMTAIDLGEYGTSYAITKDGSDKELHLTPTDDILIDMALYDETGATIATGTLFSKAVADTTPERLAKLVAACF